MSLIKVLLVLIKKVYLSFVRKLSIIDDSGGFGCASASSQAAIAYSKLAIEILANMFKVNNKDTRTTPLAFHTLFYCFYR